jgi:hypothetical protein
MNQTRRLAAIFAADVAGYVISTYKCSHFRTEFAADSPLEGSGLELSIPRQLGQRFRGFVRDGAERLRGAVVSSVHLPAWAEDRFSAQNSTSCRSPPE